MLLCLDIGNSHLCGGVFKNNELLIQFRYSSKHIGTSDEVGIFILNVLRENKINPKLITKIGIASVVPSNDYSVRAACIKYLKIIPQFLSPCENIAGIKVKTDRPEQTGADLIASAIAAKTLYPKQHILVFDFGTATTCCYINDKAEFIGATITPGIRLMMESLSNNAAKLFSVELLKPTEIIGRDTSSAIQSGIYYAQIGLVYQLIHGALANYNLPERPIVIGTGGYSGMFASEKLFDLVIPELVLIGVKHMLELSPT